MRTTLSLDDDVAAAVQRLREERNLGLSEAVNELVRAGLGIAALPDFLIGDGLQPLGEPLHGYDTTLWLLTRPDCRALRSVVTLFDELGRALKQP
jgi:DNA-binding transcriptional LysR family regulator